MSRVVNCDTTFDVLTRGPFPGGDANDDAVHAHLLVCFECRQMAESLRPATNLFHECLDPTETARLPAYLAAETSLESRIMVAIGEHAGEHAGDRASDTSVASRSTWLASRTWAAGSQAAPVLATALFLAPVILFLLLASSFVWRAPGGAGTVAADELELKPVSGDQLLALLDLPNMCKETNPTSLVASMPHAKAKYGCCTNCHSAAAKTHMSISCVARLSTACNACHVPTQTKHVCCDDCHESLVSTRSSPQSLAGTCEACHRLGKRS